MEEQVGHRRTIHLLIARSNRAAVEIIGHAQLAGQRQVLAELMTHHQGIADAFTIKCGHREVIQHTALIDVDAAVVVVGMEPGDVPRKLC